MNKIDYSNYTLDELFDVKRNIDSEQFPERYQTLLEEILKKEAENTVGLSDSRFELFDDDPVSKLTAWTPAKSGGSNFKTHKLVEIDHWRLEFKPTVYFILFTIFFSGFSIYIFIRFGLSLFTLEKLLFSIENLFAFISYSIFILFSTYLVYKLTEKIIFDKDAQIFWKGRKKPKHSINQKPLKNYTEFSNIHAIQLITEFCNDGNSNYYSFELNLVLKDSQRLNVIDHGNQQAIREDANRLADFLNVPVWEFHEEKERNFFIRLLGLKF